MLATAAVGAGNLRITMDNDIPAGSVLNINLGDVAALTQALLQLVADPSLRQRMGQAAMQSADARFSLSTWAARVEAVYQKAQPKTGRG